MINDATAGNYFIAFRTGAGHVLVTMSVMTVEAIDVYSLQEAEDETMSCSASL